MFKLIKEFFVGKPTVVEIPAEAPVPVVEIKPETVVVSVSDSTTVSINTQPDTIGLSTPSDSIAWPFPTTPPVEAAVRKKRTTVKPAEPVTTKKPTPFITASNKSRKKK